MQTYTSYTSCSATIFFTAGSQQVSWQSDRWDWQKADRVVLPQQHDHHSAQQSYHSCGLCSVDGRWSARCNRRVVLARCCEWCDLFPRRWTLSPHPLPILDTFEAEHVPDKIAASDRRWNSLQHLLPLFRVGEVNQALVAATVLFSVHSRAHHHW